MWDREVIQELGKLGLGTIALLGTMIILYTVVKDDAAEEEFLREHMLRQTEAMERLVQIYSGEDE